MQYNSKKYKFRVGLKKLVCVIGTLLSCGCSNETVHDARLLVSLEKLPPTTEDYVYELRYKKDGEYITLKRIQTTTGTVNISIPIAEGVDNVNEMILSVESAGSSSLDEGGSVLLAGSFIGDEARLSVDHELALAIDFSSAYGTYRLASPTSRETPFDQGIWWCELNGNTPVQSLYLPNLPAGWIYEGWVVGGEKPLSTGKFPDPSRFDSDLAGDAASNSNEPPPFPGQDYISPPKLLPGLTAMITIEPLPDVSLSPFEVKILIDRVIEAVDINQPMENRTENTMPEGSVKKILGIKQ